MPQSTPPDEKSDPVQSKLLGAEAIVQVAHPLKKLIQKTRGLQRRAHGFFARRLAADKRCSLGQKGMPVIDNFWARAASVSVQSFLNHCGEYQRALTLLAASPLPPITVMGSLAAHTIELALKAYLVACGMAEDDFVGKGKIGHDLERALAECEQRNFRFNRERTWLGLLNLQHNNPYLYRYGRDGWGQSIPGDPRSLCEYVDSLVADVQTSIDRLPR